MNKFSHDDFICRCGNTAEIMCSDCCVFITCICCGLSTFCAYSEPDDQIREVLNHWIKLGGKVEPRI